ncbi:hypothetical protein AALP_AA3G295200 [Arabis alpina]|uniref:CCHC-type domain-containing protein n=1 Tax=Arabis alpina TaxID=50452 RepID=A0A087HCJ2_ARAAL|nr:hypothetical protein AALP_AA3G295200 [Arabis alpina]
MSHVTKLTGTNYLMWSLQVKAFLDGHGLIHHIDESMSIPVATLIVGTTTTPNPAFIKWNRQDKLIYSALLGAISTPVQAIVSLTTSSSQIWTKLASTYANPSRGHILQLREQLKFYSKGTKTIDEYIQGITTRLNELAILGKPSEHEDSIDIILKGLPEDYKTVKDQIGGKDTPPSITEIHERLLNHEAKLLIANNDNTTAAFPISANNVQQRHHNNRNNNNYNRNNNNYNRSFTSNKPYVNNPNWQAAPPQQSGNNSRGPRPYLGKCQICHPQGHSARRCPQLSSLQSTTSQPPSTPFRPWQPRANLAMSSPYTAENWLLDSGATHHITSDLNNLNLHHVYNGGDDVLLADGSNLAITHTGEGSEHGGPVTPRPN